ncbi:alpha/beta fold hydrolase [Nocardioides sp. YIM 152315]|uniref:alpha/beta fold hydrolase n=1 Tax=Nocardioides sp. YIM 152315 TaxID=3031760 RepID=UPI0023DB7AE5|nr:alpha/beta fold hydrolase [Nocardioides sp. YIM 152315]MDF1605385.1 alpha/beta fold hydrolase [Nocardioides sp. YIM 152315]
MRSAALADFLLPDGFAAPGAAAVLRESSAVVEIGRFALRAAGDRRTRRGSSDVARTGVARSGDPVLLVPGFLAGDGTLGLMARALRARGLRTYRSHIHANIGCTRTAAEQLEARLESIATRRDSRVQVVGHSLGGMLARGIAARRPDLVSHLVTMGSPMLAPGAHHRSLGASVDLLVRLSRAGVPGLMAEDCVAGSCARESFEECRRPMPPGIGFTAVYSRRDGIVDWRACIDPLATAVEVSASHLGMAFDPRVIDVVADSLRRTPSASAVEVDRGKSA